MLQFIILKNMFNHEYSEIPISKHLTVITGDNGAGKSSIFHAINWFISNKPKNTRFIRNGEKFASTSLVVDGIMLTKSKNTKGESTFILDDTGEEFFKADLPKEFADVIGIKPYYDFGSKQLELNFIFQMDSPFLLSYEASAGASVLGQLSGAEYADLAVADVDLESYRLKAQMKKDKDLLEQKEQDILFYDSLPSIYCKLIALKENINALKNLQTKLLNLKDLALKFNIADMRKISINKKINDLQSVINFNNTILFIKTKNTINMTYVELSTNVKNALTKRALLEKRIQLVNIGNYKKSIIDIINNITKCKDLINIKVQINNFSVNKNIISAKVNELRVVSSCTNTIKNIVKYLQIIININVWNTLLINKTQVTECIHKYEVVCKYTDKLHKLNLLLNVYHKKYLQSKILISLRMYENVLNNIKCIYKIAYNLELSATMNKKYNLDSCIKNTANDIIKYQENINEIFNTLGMCPMCKCKGELK